MMGVPGRLQVMISPEINGMAVAVTPPPAVPATALMRGRTPEDAARLSSLIFNLCSAAQGLAVRAAFGLPVSPKTAANVRRETLRDHVMKLTTVWPKHLGLKPDPSTASLTSVEVGDENLVEALRAELYGQSRRLPSRWNRFEAWIDQEDCLPAAMLKALLRFAPEPLGAVDTPLFEPNEPVDWPAAEQDGAAVENSPFCRLNGYALLDSIVSRRGRDVLARITARLVEVERLLDADPRYGEALRLDKDEDGTCVGGALAARGLMLVQGKARDGVVEQFDRLSPTDFAIADGGVLQSALRALRADRGYDLGTAARLVVDVIDPCCPADVIVQTDAKRMEPAHA